MTFEEKLKAIEWILAEGRIIAQSRPDISAHLAHTGLYLTAELKKKDV